jgi:hypothetical protein
MVYGNVKRKNGYLANRNGHSKDDKMPCSYLL